jgi:hypothetical protein
MQPLPQYAPQQQSSIPGEKFFVVDLRIIQQESMPGENFFGADLMIMILIDNNDAGR